MTDNVDDVIDTPVDDATNEQNPSVDEATHEPFQSTHPYEVRQHSYKLLITKIKNLHFCE